MMRIEYANRECAAKNIKIPVVYGMNNRCFTIKRHDEQH